MTLAAAGVATIALTSLTISQAAASDGDLPDATLTPGAVRTTDKDEICTTKTGTVRNVPNSVKEQVRRAYGMSNKRDKWCNTTEGCEIDHLISLELGGSNDPKNLWPEPYEGTVWNAHVKDQLENRLHKMICGGQIGVEDAQKAIATDWVSAYKKYISPTPVQATKNVPGQAAAPTN